MLIDLQQCSLLIQGTEDVQIMSETMDEKSVASEGITNDICITQLRRDKRASDKDIIGFINYIISAENA